MSGNFPSGPVDKTPSSQCRGLGFDPWSGNQDLTYHNQACVPHLEKPMPLQRSSMAKINNKLKKKKKTNHGQSLPQKGNRTGVWEPLALRGKQYLSSSTPSCSWFLEYCFNSSPNEFSEAACPSPASDRGSPWLTITRGWLYLTLSKAIFL